MSAHPSRQEQNNQDVSIRLGKALQELSAASGEPACTVINTRLPLNIPHLLLLNEHQLTLVCHTLPDHINSHHEADDERFLYRALQAFDELKRNDKWLRLLIPELATAGAEPRPISLLLVTATGLPAAGLLTALPNVRLYTAQTFTHEGQHLLRLDEVEAETPPSLASPDHTTAHASGSATGSIQPFNQELNDEESAFFERLEL